METILPVKPPIDLPVWDQTSYLVVLGVGMGLILLLHLLLKSGRREVVPEEPVHPLLEECLWCEKLLDNQEHEEALEILEGLVRGHLSHHYERDFESHSEAEMILILREDLTDHAHFEAFFVFIEPIKFGNADIDGVALREFHIQLKDEIT